MKAEYINPFLRSLANTFDTMLNCKVQRGQISLAHTGGKEFSISGVIGLCGRAAGSVVINLSQEVALKAASAMLMEECTEVNHDVLDAVGEIANMVAGAAKAELEQLDLSVSLPNVVRGEQHEICWPSSSPPLSVPFETDFGPLRLEVGLEESGSGTATVRERAASV